ncbi:MAG: O-antigen ligase family protein, partial [Desulfobacterales bacterium]|nr:O-antigen ligase family protein [Desulfobacterales bacterium]
KTNHGSLRIPKLKLNTHNSKLSTIFIFLFLLLILFQLLPLPPGLLKILSPKTYGLRSALSLQPSSLSFPLSFFPFATQIELFKWLTFAGLFIFLLYWKPFEEDHRIKTQLIIVILLVGIAESLYGMFEFFSGHRYILHLNASSLVSSVTGTFINRNAFAGYLLMVIPLSIGFLFSREATRRAGFEGWRHRLSTLDGKTLLIAFGIMIMILGLLFSASRMGIVSLLLSFSLMALLLGGSQRGRRFSGQSILILGLALIWALWIGLDAVISRFFAVSEDFEMRWDIWTDTFKILKDFPIFGSGLGTFHQIFPIYRSFHIRGLVTHAENDFLQLASEVGLLGIGLLIVLFVTLFYKAISGIRSLSFRDGGRYIGAGGMVGILALMFHSIVERNLQIPANAFLFIFIWALVLRMSLSEKGSYLAKPGGYQAKESR